MAPAATRSTTAPQRTRTLTPSEIGWLAAIPAAVAGLLAIWLLGPPLGRTLFPAGAIATWPSFAPMIRPEAAEQGRYLLSLGVPLLLAALTVAGARSAPPLSDRTARVLVGAVQVAGAAFVVVCLVAQHRVSFPYYETLPYHVVYFTTATLVVAALLTAAVLATARSDAARARVANWLRETRAARVAAPAVAVLFVLVWLLHAFNTEDTIALANYNVSYHLQFTLDETFAVLDGRSPLVDFSPQYGSLWPYAFAAVMALLGETVTVYLALSLLVTGIAMLAMYGVLRRVTASSVAALLLFLPFLASSFFLIQGPLENRYTFGTLTGAYPLRFAGPFVLLWLLARHLQGAAPRRRWLLFLVAGLVVLNNADIGIPALGATVAALLWAQGRPTRASLGRLAAAIAAGLAAAFALVSILTLLRAGSLPDPSLLLRYSRMFGAAGFGLLPMPTLGLHLVIYATYVAAIGVATARAVGGERDRLLTGALAWCGVFGLGAGSYYVGRSHPESLTVTFAIWSFTLALLTVVVVRSLAARRGRFSLAQAACLFGFAVATCSLAQTPLPWKQLERLRDTADPVLAAPAGQAFVDEHTDPGEHAAILTQLSHRIGANLDVENVSSYTGVQSMPLVEQLTETIDALRAEGGRKIFIPPPPEAASEMSQALQLASFMLRDTDPETGVALWVDATAPR